MSGKTIWKFKINDNNRITAPIERFLAVQFQGDDLCIWAEVDPCAPDKNFNIDVVGTGHRVPENVNYLGTVQQLGGIFIWHIYWKEIE